MSTTRFQVGQASVVALVGVLAVLFASLFGATPLAEAAPKAKSGVTTKLTWHDKKHAAERRVFEVTYPTVNTAGEDVQGRVQVEIWHGKAKIIKTQMIDKPSKDGWPKVKAKVWSKKAGCKPGEKSPPKRARFQVDYMPQPIDDPVWKVRVITRADRCGFVVTSVQPVYYK